MSAALEFLAAMVLAVAALAFVLTTIAGVALAVTSPVWFPILLIWG